MAKIAVCHLSNVGGWAHMCTVYGHMLWLLGACVWAHACFCVCMCGWHYCSIFFFFLHHLSFVVSFYYAHRIGHGDVTTMVYLFSTSLFIYRCIWLCALNWSWSSLILCFAQTHPFHWYFTSALPRSLLAAYPLCLVR